MARALVQVLVCLAHRKSALGRNPSRSPPGAVARSESAATEAGLRACSSGGCGLSRILVVPIAIAASAAGEWRAQLRARPASYR